jgi:hypothetical protein
MRIRILSVFVMWIEGWVMNGQKEIGEFMERMREDPRIGPPHVSLYMAIFYWWLAQGSEGPVSFTARELMPWSKIGGSTLFYQCLKELHLYRYLMYEPSFNPALKSRVYLVFEDVHIVYGNGSRV